MLWDCIGEVKHNFYGHEKRRSSCAKNQVTAELESPPPLPQHSVETYFAKSCSFVRINPFFGVVLSGRSCCGIRSRLSSRLPVRRGDRLVPTALVQSRGTSRVIGLLRT